MTEDIQDHPDNPSVPAVEISEVLGLLEVLKNKGGKEDIYKLAAELQMEAGDTLKVIRSAEILQLVHTPGGDVVLEKLGSDLTKVKVNDRKLIVKKQLEQVPIFAELCKFVRQEDQEEEEVDKEKVLEKLADLLPNEDAEKSFNIIVQWGRYAELFGYNDDTETFYLDDGE